jgi:hypothetical protein
MMFESSTVSTAVKFAWGFGDEDGRQVNIKVSAGNDPAQSRVARLFEPFHNVLRQGHDVMAGIHGPPAGAVLAPPYVGSQPRASSPAIGSVQQKRN